jgi:hypothetical protein
MHSIQIPAQRRHLISFLGLFLLQSAGHHSLFVHLHLYHQPIPKIPLWSRTRHEMTAKTRLFRTRRDRTLSSVQTSAAHQDLNFDLRHNNQESDQSRFQWSIYGSDNMQTSVEKLDASSGPRPHGTSAQNWQMFPSSFMMPSSSRINSSHVLPLLHRQQW